MYCMSHVKSCDHGPAVSSGAEGLYILWRKCTTKQPSLRVPRQVQVWDTAGQERFRKSMVEHYYRNVHAVVFVYDVTKMNSFRNLQTWIQVSRRAAAPRGITFSED